MFTAGLAVAGSATGGDTKPPKPPANLVLRAATDTTLSVAWSTDEGKGADEGKHGVAAYGLYRDGALVDATQDKSFTFTGLACGRKYLLGVDAADKAGNRSGAVTLSASTAACSADLFVAPNGADFRWTFLAATFDGSALDLYVDGRLVQTTNASGPIAA